MPRMAALHRTQRIPCDPVNWGGSSLLPPASSVQALVCTQEFVYGITSLSPAQASLDSHQRALDN